MASKEEQTVRFAITDESAALDGALLEIGRRAMQGWRLVGYALTFERPVRVEVAVHHDPKLPRPHHKG